MQDGYQYLNAQDLKQSGCLDPGTCGLSVPCPFCGQLGAMVVVENGLVGRCL